jgi:hypothetical protein
LSLRFIRGIASSAEALGRSRGGLGTKIVGICDAAGRLVDVNRAGFTGGDLVWVRPP